MQLQGQPYTVTILGQDGKPVQETAEGYVGLAHGEHYKIKIETSGCDRAAAEIKVDGESVGKFVVPVGRAFELERPVSIAKLFTFLAEGTPEATAALLTAVKKDDLGLITIKISPEKERPPVRMMLDSDFNTRGADRFDFGSGGMKSMGVGFGAGGTGLSGISAQRFVTVSMEVDETRAVTFNLRLVHDKARTIEPDVQPLPGRLPKSTPVPPPVGGEPAAAPGTPENG